MKIKKKSYDFFFNNCCLNIVIFSLIFCNCFNSVSLVDKRAGFFNWEVVGSNPGSVKFFSFSFSFF